MLLSGTWTGPPDGLDAHVRDSRAAMVPHWGEHAYVNDADATIEGHRTAYYGDNAARLAEVSATFDPDRSFTQPQPLTG